MVLSPSTSTISHHVFSDISSFLGKNDVLILNDTKVFNARLKGTKSTGGRIELFLLESTAKDIWRCLAPPGKRLKVGDIIHFSDNFSGTILEKGLFLLSLSYSGLFFDVLAHYGEPPLPPYIKPQDPSSFKDRYQTTFAEHHGSIAAPTAGLHFTNDLLMSLREKGVMTETITLHVGYGTFKPVESTHIKDHPMHAETFHISEKTAERLTRYKSEGKRFVSVGTTSTRALESAYVNQVFIPGKHSSNLFIFPGYSYKAIDGLITNFHLPKSSLLMLVSALQELNLLKRLIKKPFNKNIVFIVLAMRCIFTYEVYLYISICFLL